MAVVRNITGKREVRDTL
jgi:hypothetical protein